MSNLFCRLVRFHLIVILPRRGHQSAHILLATLAVIAFLSPSRTWATATATTTALTVTSAGSEVMSVDAGTVITLTATVTSAISPGTSVNPGLVEFCDATAVHCEDSALLGTAQLTTAGMATFKFRPGIGSHTYQAVFAGTGSYAKSISSTATLTVTGLYPTASSIVSSGSVGNYTLTATVVGAGSPTFGPTGEVSFLDTTSGNASLGTAALRTAMLGLNFVIGSALSIGSGHPPSSWVISTGTASEIWQRPTTPTVR